MHSFTISYTDNNKADPVYEAAEDDETCPENFNVVWDIKFMNNLLVMKQERDIIC